MKNTRIAQAYGKALFDFAHEMQIIEEVSRDMKLVSRVIKSNHDFKLLLLSPVIRVDKKIAIINGIFEKHLHATTVKYLRIIIRKRREKYIPDIAEKYDHFYKEYKGIETARLITAGNIDDQTKESILEYLRGTTGAKIELTEEIDSELIGGFVLKFDDKQYDASILKQIKLLQRDFDENIYIRGY